MYTSYLKYTPLFWKRKIYIYLKLLPVLIGSRAVEEGLQTGTSSAFVLASTGLNCSIGCYCKGQGAPCWINRHYSFGQLICLESPLPQQLVICLLSSNFLSSWAFDLLKEEEMSPAEELKNPPLEDLTVDSPSAKCWSILLALFARRCFWLECLCRVKRQGPDCFVTYLDLILFKLQRKIIK